MALGLFLSLSRPVGGGSGGAVAYTPPVPSYTGTMAHTEDDDYHFYTLSDDGDLTFDRAGAADVELIGGGGGGGGAYFSVGGGGGAGGLVLDVVSISSGETYSVVIGSGGSGGVGSSTSATVGGDTSAFGLTVAGGGWGATNNASPTQNPGDGGCGGGARNSSGFFGTGSLGGNGGGATGSGSGTAAASGGGGGMGGDGGAAGVSTAGAAGPGVVSILGDTVCTGGAGGTRAASGAGAGGTAAGDGGGGAANSSATNGGAGAAGRVVIRIPKDASAYSISFDEAPVSGFGYSLDSALASADVPVSATVLGASDGDQVEARVIDSSESVVVDWASLGSVSGGAVSGTITVPATNDLLRVEARIPGRDGRSYTQETPWATAVRIIAYGQSNSLGAATSGSAGATMPETCTVVSAAGPTWRTDGAYVSMADELSGMISLPVMVISGGLTGTPINGLDYGESPFTQLTDAMTEFGGGFHVLNWHQGEGDVYFPTGSSIYAGLLGSIRSDLVDHTGQAFTPPIVLSSLSTATSGITVDIGDDEDENWQAVKDMQKDYLPSNITDCHFVAPWDDAVRFDTYHAYGPSYTRRTLREARKIAHILGYASDPGVFQIATATATSDTTTTVTVSHGLGSDIELVSMDHLGGSGEVDAETSIDSFEVTVDGWVTPVACTAVRTDATTLTLTHASISTSGRRVRYFYGLNPDGCVRDNSAYNYPLQYESDLACS